MRFLYTEQFRMGEIPYKRNYPGFIGNLRDERLKHHHAITALHYCFALLRFHTEGVANKITVKFIRNVLMCYDI